MCIRDRSLADQYVELLMMDAFCLNADRHTNNYGVLRDPDSGKVLRLAPNFDNNIALISTGYLDKPRGADLLTGSSVSYTHLDVYKRQDVVIASRLFLLSLKVKNEFK